MSEEDESGPLVQFVRTWTKRVGSEWGAPEPGDRWVVDGEACVVTRVVHLGNGKVRAYVEKDTAFTVPTSSLDAPPVHHPMGEKKKLSSGDGGST